MIEKENIKVSLKIGNDNEIVTAGKYEKSAKDTSKKPAADKRKKSQPAEQEKDKTIVAEIAEAKQQPEEKITQKPVQNNNQKAQNNNQPTAQQPEQKPEQKPDQQPEQKPEQPAVKDPAKDSAYHLVWPVSYTHLHVRTIRCFHRGIHGSVFRTLCLIGNLICGTFLKRNTFLYQLYTVINGSFLFRRDLYGVCLLYTSSGTF